MVTAEFAVALPAFVLVVIAALCGVSLVVAQLRCVDAAAVAARMSARGDTSGLVASAVASTAPSGARLSIVTTSDLVVATVRTRVSFLGLSRLLPRVVVSADEAQARESPTLVGVNGG
jgi:Asp/Glu/hydantoin racemase